MGVPMPTFPDAVPGIPKGGSLPTTAASSGSATALRRPWRNRKAASDMRKCQRAHRKGVLVSTHSRCPMGTRRSAPAHSRSALKARPRDALPTQVVTDFRMPHLSDRPVGSVPMCSLGTRLPQHSAGGSAYATSCCLIQSRRAWSIRVCQPRPPARKWSMTSCDNRMVVDTFDRAFGGRPRRTPWRTSPASRPSRGQARCRDQNLGP